MYSDEEDKNTEEDTFARVKTTKYAVNNCSDFCRLSADDFTTRIRARDRVRAKCSAALAVDIFVSDAQSFFIYIVATANGVSRVGNS